MYALLGIVVGIGMAVLLPFLATVLAATIIYPFYWFFRELYRGITSAENTS